MNVRIPVVVVGLLLATAGMAAAQEASDTIMSVAAVQERPEPVPNSCQAPQYPPQARVARLEGRVLVRFIVGTDGRVEPGSVSVLTSSFQQFEGPARQAISTCRYRPARFNDQPVRVVVQAPVEFRLTQRRS